MVGQRQQRLRLRRLERQHALVQHDARPRDAARTLRLCHSRFGLGRIAGREEEDFGFSRHLPDRRALFVGLLVGVIVIFYLLQYFPALSLGPIVEHFLMLDGKTF